MKARNLQVGDVITQYETTVGEMTVTRINSRHGHVKFETDNPRCPSHWFPHHKNISVKEDNSGKGFSK